METMMENLKLERERSKQEISELVNAITNMPSPNGRLKCYVFLDNTSTTDGYLTHTFFC